VIIAVGGAPETREGDRKNTQGQKNTLGRKKKKNPLNKKVKNPSKNINAKVKEIKTTDRMGWVRGGVRPTIWIQRKRKKKKVESEHESDQCVNLIW